jgi:formylglycine-generating enzyme required for sulfatase activity
MDAPPFLCEDAAMTPHRPTPKTPPPADRAKPNQGTTSSGTHHNLRLEPGEHPLPEYLLVRRLGEGSAGQVWLATGPGGYKVALKFVKIGASTGAAELKALKAVKEIRHAHLLAVFGIWQKAGHLIIAMELADRSLVDRLKEAVAQGQPGIPRDELMEYMHDAARGLDVLNERGIIHRDVKPHNLFLSSGSVKVADYGLAKILEKTLTTVSTKMTPAYAAPEFFNGQATKWSDQYCLAVAYCQMRTNVLPFQGAMQQLVAGHLLREPDLSALPAAERPIVAKALAKEPRHRWPSCREFVRQLGEAVAGQTDLMPSSSPALVLVPTTPVSDATSSDLEEETPSAARPWPAGLVMGIGIVALLALIVGVTLYCLLTGPTMNAVTEDPRSVALNLPPLSTEEAAQAQTAAAARLRLPLEINSPSSIKFRLIPPGEFIMGSPSNERDREPDEVPHRVRISRPFHLAVHEVTRGQFRHFVESTGYVTEAEKDGLGSIDWKGVQQPHHTWKNPGFTQTDDHPVVNVSWSDAQAFCRWLSLQDGRTYRLPTEAEWEYACRAGTATRFHSGPTDEALAKAGNVADDSFRKATGGTGGLPSQDGFAFTAPVGQFAPNAWGLCDMHGNAWEWCQDWYDREFYRQESGLLIDPVNERMNRGRVMRGGSWGSPANKSRAAFRGMNEPTKRVCFVGFRVVVQGRGP